MCKSVSKKKKKRTLENVFGAGFYTSSLSCFLQIYACMMVFFLSNMIENQLMSTGAFEITLNGEFVIYRVTFID